MLVCPQAATAPTRIEARAATIMICRQASVAGPIASIATRTDSAMPATFCAEANSVVTGVGAFSLFYGAAHVCRHVPVLDKALARVLRFADRGSTPLVVLTTCANGVAELRVHRVTFHAQGFIVF